MDSSGIGLILDRVRTAALCGRVTVRGLSPQLKEKWRSFLASPRSRCWKTPERSENMKQIIPHGAALPVRLCQRAFARGGSRVRPVADPLVTDLNDLKTAVSGKP